MRRRRLLDALAATMAAAALPSSARAQGAAQLADARRLQAHVRFLADPLLEGREAGTRGFDLAAAYVASQFTQLGLKPLGDGREGNGYLQAVPLKSARLAATAPVLELCRGDRCERLAYLDEFQTRPDFGEARSDVKAPLVFAGYGVTAPRNGWDDYAGLDVKGRIVVVLSGRPPRMPPEEGAHFGNGRTKAELAARHGAVGLISLATPRSEVASPFHAGRQYANDVSIDWQTPDGRGGNDIPGMRVSAGISLQVAPRFLASLTDDYARLVVDAETGRPLPRGDLGLNARLARETVHGQARSCNVLGFVEGSHPQLNDEVIVLSAHLDHLGRKPGPQGDVIYPGAMDNAMGIAVLLETARLCATSPTAPGRSVLFAAFTGEEQGQVGSSYFNRHAPVPVERLVAAANIDMPILLHDFKEVVDIGGEHSTLGASVDRAANALGLRRVADPTPEQNRFTRSDQYSFVKRGIPAVILGPGGASFDGREDGDSLIRDFRRLRYHQPGDDLGQPFHWAAAQRFAQLHWAFVKDVAELPERPHWFPGDFFGDLFGRQ